MTYSFVEKTGDGNTRSFTFSFEGQDDGYLREEDVVVMVDGVEAPFSFLSSNTLELYEAPAQGAEIIIRRVMPKEIPYADFKRGNNFGPEALNKSFLQLLYVVHEILDGWFPANFKVREAIEFLKKVTIRRAVDFDEPARKDQLDEESDERKSEDNDIREAFSEADANLQAQITGDIPLEASAFSPISWHDPIIENSVTIPDNKNAWSFGPSMEVGEGVTITVGDSSSWKIS